MRLILCFFLICFNLQAKENKKPFKTFTGKILGNKVRLRSEPDLDSQVIKQMNKSDLLLVTGETEDFWAVSPPKGTKAYVYRTYVLDGVVEANRVNARLEPSIDAPIVAQLEMGERVGGDLCRNNSKWVEIAPPKNMRFYISKEYVGFAGGPDHLKTMERKKDQGVKALQKAFTTLNKTIKMPFKEMKTDTAIQEFEAVINNFSDFDDFVKQAKEGLAILKESYTKKKIAFLENKANGEKVADVSFPKYANRSKTLSASIKTKNLPAKMRKWEEVEDSLYLSWRTFNTNKNIEEFYKEQKMNADVISGRLESYEHMVKNKPGDFVLKSHGNPVAYLYSMHVNLNEHVGKKVKLIAAPRPNNHFAFPAYYVLEVR